MKKIFFLIMVLLLLGNINVASADDKYFCDCTNSNKKEKVQGQDCMTFASSGVMDAICPESCVKQSGTPSTLCLPAAATFDPQATAGATNTDSAKVIKLNNPLAGNVTDVNVIVGNIINAALGIMGALVLLMIVWGGFTWLTAAGNPEKVKSGANTIVWAILGAVVVLGSYFLLTTVLKALAG